MSKNYGLGANGKEADITRGDLVRFFVTDLLPMQNYRFWCTDTSPEVKALRAKKQADMTASLYAEGQKTPLRVYEVPGKRFRIHAGDTRYWSFVEIDKKRDWPWGKKEDEGRPRVECLVETFDPKIDRDKAAFGSSLTENIQRNDLTLVDLSNAVIIAERQGYTPAEIMAQLRQTDPSFISRMHKIAVLPVARKRELFLNQLSASTAYLLAEIPEEEHESILEEAATLEPEASSHSADSVDPRPNAPKKRGRPAKKASARSVATVAKKRGLLKNKSTAHTIAGQREFWTPYAERGKESLMGRLAVASLDWLRSADDESYFKAVTSLLRGASKAA
jgi:hypothetical protein